MTLHAGVDPDMTADDRTGPLLERAYTVLMARQVPFTPEDFALYFLSRLVDEVDPRDREGFRRAAARYMLEKHSRLSREFRALSDEASRFLSRPSSDNGTAETPCSDDVPPAVSAERMSKRDAFVFDLSRENRSLALLLTRPEFVPRS